MTNQELISAMQASGRLIVSHVGEQAPKNRLAIRNDFTGKETSVDTSIPLNRQRVLQIRRRLCADECTSGDTLGARGPQDERYKAFRDRADRTILTGELS